MSHEKKEDSKPEKQKSISSPPASKKMGPRQSVNCTFDEENETVQAIRAHLDKAFLGDFHLQTTWQVVLIVLGVELGLYFLYKLYLRRKKKLKKKKLAQAQVYQQMYGGQPIHQPYPPPLYDFPAMHMRMMQAPGGIPPLPAARGQGEGQKKEPKANAQQDLNDLKNGEK